MANEVGQSEKVAAKALRAKAFAENLRATGLTLGEFAKEAAFTRNVIYNLSIGQAPSSAEQAKRLADTFHRLRKT